MLLLKESLAAWGDPSFSDIFKSEVEQLRHEDLPLQQGLSLSSYVSSDDPFKVMVINSSEDAGQVRIKAGVFYSGIIAGCSCADDPTPTDVQAEYCDLEFRINNENAETRVTLLSD